MVDRDSAARVVGALAAAQRQSARLLDRALSEVELTYDQWLLLRAVRDVDAATMGDLSQRVGLTPATTTRAVDCLVDSALVYRHSSREDRRRVVVALSDRGRGRLAQADDVVESMADTIFASDDVQDLVQTWLASRLGVAGVATALTDL